MLHLPIGWRPYMPNESHTCDAVGIIVSRASSSKQMNEGGGAMRSKHAAHRTKEP